MSHYSQDLLRRIEAFLSTHKMTPTRFGIEACGDGKLVSEIRAGRSVTLALADRLYAFMEKREAMESADA